MIRARIHKARPRQSHRAPIETIVQAAAAYGGFKAMAKAFDLPPETLFAWTAPSNGVPEYNRLGIYLGLVMRGHVPSPKLFGCKTWADLPGVGEVRQARRR